MRTRWTVLVAALLAGSGLLLAPAQAAVTIPATGTFAFTTANGILPTWEYEDLVLIGVSPGSVTTSTIAQNAQVTVPLVAKTGTANHAAGGFRFNNTTTGASVRCSNPTIDTRARVVDCVLNDGTHRFVFAITAIGSWSRAATGTTVTTTFRDMVLRINGQQMADMLNEQLDTTAFSPYVTIGTGNLTVTRRR
jgi:hypothetical protein